MHSFSPALLSLQSHHQAGMSTFIPTRHLFPISNMRGCPETPPPTPPPLPKRKARAIRIGRLKEPKDHLTQPPKKGYRYLSITGRPLFDNRYNGFPPPPKKRRSVPARPRAKRACRPSTKTAKPVQAVEPLSAIRLIYKRLSENLPEQVFLYHLFCFTVSFIDFYFPACHFVHFLLVPAS